MTTFYSLRMAPMKKRNILAATVALTVVFVMIVILWPSAQDVDQFGEQGPSLFGDDFGQMIQDLHNGRAQIEGQLSIDPLASGYPHATSYYDDLEHHYELLFLKADVISAAIK